MYAECYDCNKLCSDNHIFLKYIFGSLKVFCEDCYLKRKDVKEGDKKQCLVGKSLKE